jgi:hypothetical protein
VSQKAKVKGGRNDSLLWIIVSPTSVHDDIFRYREPFAIPSTQIVIHGQVWIKSHISSLAPHHARHSKRHFVLEFPMREAHHAVSGRRATIASARAFIPSSVEGFITTLLLFLTFSDMYVCDDSIVLVYEIMSHYQVNLRFSYK